MSNATEDSMSGEEEVLPNHTEPHQDVMQTTTEGGEGSSEVAVESETLRAQLLIYSARPRHFHVQRNIIIDITLVMYLLVYLA